MSDLWLNELEQARETFSAALCSGDEGKISDAKVAFRARLKRLGFNEHEIDDEVLGATE